MSTRAQDNPIIVIILRTFIMAVCCFRVQPTNGQHTSLGRTSNYGPSSIGVGSGNGAGSGGGPSAASTGASGSGEILGPKSFQLTNHEPTCEELREMWRFSKRQSRAAEITNEIPTYRDPFAYNIWEPYYSTTRSMGGMRIVPRYRDATRPVYGRVVHREPLVRLADRTRTLDDFSRMHATGGAVGGTGGDAKGLESRRRVVQFRFSGGTAANSITPHHGSFQKLKELIWTERARELAQQRKAEEMAARAAVLKEITNGQSHSGRRQQQQQQQMASLGPSYQEDNRSPIPDSSGEGLISLPGHQRLPPSSQSGLSSSLLSPGGSSIFSMNPLSSSTRTGGLMLPVFSNAGQHQQTKTLAVPKPSHFRGRNRVLFRQSGAPAESFQRKSRDDPDDMNTPQKLLQLLSTYYPSQQESDDDYNGDFLLY